jgi:hypothetical protein
MNIGSPSLADRRGDCRQDENYTQTPQDSLPFAITRGQHNAIGDNLEHAPQRAPDRQPRGISCVGAVPAIATRLECTRAFRPTRAPSAGPGA